MLFNSPAFLFIFLPLVFCAVWVARRLSANSTAYVLSLASLVFYAAWDIDYLALLVLSVLFNFFLARSLYREPDKWRLVFGVVVNLMLIGGFKYADFFTTNVNVLTGSDWPMMNLILPLGISFFTFQQISFIVEAHKREIDAFPDLNAYLLYVSFFPQLIAGPICRPNQLLGQFRSLSTSPAVSDKDIGKGLAYIVIGLFKKVIVADSLAGFVDPSFGSVSALSFYDAWSCVLAYTLQLYFDFSAYCEIAIGIGLLFGIRLPVNFDSPYKSFDIQEFWRRWHITLGLFIKTYVYIPLGGNRFGSLVRISCLMFTMLVGGLWHGAGWTFVLWGGVHGLYLIIFLVWSSVSPFTLPKYLARSLTFLCVLLAWVLFRSESVDEALVLYATLFGFNGFELPLLYSSVPGIELLVDVGHSVFSVGYELPVLCALLWVVLTAPNTHGIIAEKKPSTPYVALLGCALLLVFFNLSKPSCLLVIKFF